MCIRDRHYIDATTITTQEQMDEAVAEYSVFGRVTPQQKQAMVKSLQAQKHTVAMTGDGVNDVLALKEADCSIATVSYTHLIEKGRHIIQKYLTRET